MQQQQPLNFSFVSCLILLLSEKFLRCYALYVSFCRWCYWLFSNMFTRMGYRCWSSSIRIIQEFFCRCSEKKQLCSSKETNSWSLEQTADHWTLGIWKEIGSNTLQWLMFVPGNNSQSIFNVIPKSFTSTLASLSNVYLLIPQKSNMDPKMAILKRNHTFAKPSFWVSTLVFGGVVCC